MQAGKGVAIGRQAGMLTSMQLGVAGRKSGRQAGRRMAIGKQACAKTSRTPQTL